MKHKSKNKRAERLAAREARQSGAAASRAAEVSARAAQATAKAAQTAQQAADVKLKAALKAQAKAAAKADKAARKAAKAMRRKARLSRVPRPRVPEKIRRRLPKRKQAVTPLEALESLPRITNETVAEHREEVLGTARKYIYPLKHSRARIIRISVALFVIAIVTFFVYCCLALYRFQSTSAFIYEVTRVIPFPIAKAGPSWVSYESYLFELRHLTHYYENQQKENFKDPKTAAHLTKLKQDSMQKVINDAYVKQLAAKNNVTVSGREVDDQIELVKSQNRLGSSDQMLSEVLKQFWGWSLDDFKREVKSQLLRQKLASSLDSATHARANNALAALNSGTDFAAVVNQFSDDEPSKARGGAYEGPISKTSRSVPPAVVDTLFKMQPSSISQIIDTGYTLEILKNTGVNGDKVTGAHISFQLQPISKYLQPLDDATKERKFIKV